MTPSEHRSIVKQVTKELLTKLPLLLNSPKVKEGLSEKKKRYMKILKIK